MSSRFPWKFEAPLYNIVVWMFHMNFQEIVSFGGGGYTCCSGIVKGNENIRFEKMFIILQNVKEIKVSYMIQFLWDHVKFICTK